MSTLHAPAPDWCPAPFSDESAIRQIEHCALPASALSCSTARRFAGRTLDHWGVPQLADDLFLVISELVTNAVRHGVGLPGDDATAMGGSEGPSARPAVHSMRPAGPVEPRGAAPIQVTMFRGDRHLVCAVVDPSNVPPVVTDATDSQEGGRGLRLVEAFSQLWGWAPVRTGGKMVWAAFSVPDRLGRRAS